MLRVLAVDDEPPALEELLYLLRADPRITLAHGAGDATEALRRIGLAMEHGNTGDHRLDAVFLDINLPGLSGLDTARLLSGFAEPPAIVFVTAHEGFAVQAFELNAADYLLKPVRRERLAEAVRRVCPPSGPPAGTPSAPIGAPAPTPVPAATAADAGPPTGAAAGSAAAVVAVPPAAATDPAEELGIAPDQVDYAEAQGDYARLYSAGGSRLVRVPLGTLEEHWQPHGFVRIHRSYLVALHAVRELRSDEGALSVLVGDTALAVSRRNARALRELLIRRAVGERG
ncbi:LytR/AlgR family response regulator transcription factor [Kitasatospora sp. LaBMicrA B282]|uniref:LytR/AlgR family response regulator transcription factor n=1 Tax=Kitasatospora sp. LaBMicrA B282 TaxID=3420949 RepID=UPI003D0E19E7